MDAQTLEKNRKHKCHRIVVTGGLGGGKTTAADLFRREIGDSIVVVPEAATMLFAGGFPRVDETEAIKLTQKSICQIQKNIEDIQSALFPKRTLLCDRGTVDGAAYWPGNEKEFFTEIGSTLEQELSRYDAVIFFETAAVGGMSIEGGNPIRNESLEAAVLLDRKLRNLWSQHPRFIFIPHDKSFFNKITQGLNSMVKVVGQFNQ